MDSENRFSLLSNVIKIRYSGMAGRGRPSKLGSFEASTFFTKLMKRASFVDVAMLEEDRGLLVERLSAPTIHRLLEKWGMRVDRDEFPDPGGPKRSVTIQACKWVQPPETHFQGTPLVSGTLWRILTGKGLMAFMLTVDGSPETAKRVAFAAAERLGSRKRRVITNHAGLNSALQPKLEG